MQTSYALGTIAQLFVAQDSDSYTELTNTEAWAQFLAQAEAAGAATDAVSEPLTFEDHDLFCRRHFTGGLPASALPVESLYENNSHVSQSSLCQTAPRGTYMGSSAQYMQKLITALGFGLPTQFNATPDHLSLECDVAAFLQESGQGQNAAEFMAERFLWLPAYKERLSELHDDTKLFFMGLVDVLMACAASHTEA